MEKLFAKIDAEPSRKAASLDLSTRIGEFFAGLRPRTLAWSAALAALAIVLQAGLITSVVLKDDATGAYETASAARTAKGDGTYALIRFRPQASAEDVTKFLETNKLTLAGGPSAGGLYRVRIAAATLPKDETARLVKTLQDDKVVGFIATTE
jgi:hypothetical protein